VIENKRNERAKERQEGTRGGKPFRSKDLKKELNAEGNEAGGTEDAEENNIGQRKCF
jgi:hypothetical protein